MVPVTTNQLWLVDPLVLILVAHPEIPDFRR